MTSRWDEEMLQAAELARPTHPHPNPRVGAIVLDASGETIGRGWHVGPGSPHAEIVALAEAGDRARGGTVVVTLEPCTHHGRTPPCVDALLAAGVDRVVVGARDPDPRVQGAGLDRLREAGVEVITGVGPGEQVDPAYFHHRRTGRPHVTLKLAATLDGQVAASDGTSRWITGTEARTDAHRLRADVDAVMVGAGTVIADDPLLDVRLPDHDGYQPRAVVAVGERPLPAGARIWKRNPLVLEQGTRDLSDTLRAVADEGILALLVEGGPRLARSLWTENLVDRGVFYFGAMVAGGHGRSLFDGVWSTLGEARSVRIDSVTRLGDDLRVDFSPS
ncbi:MAG: bifunctional diaminohydroxyphosphoribosylaminopyrimidine deaminase/5-amino-6-(5-phosphoribosylamino)uracil reductase RibD [Acidimicrobiia bacterium]